MVDNELDSVELLDVSGDGRMFIPRVNHHGHVIFGGGGQDMFMRARGQSFQVQAGSDPETKPAGRLANLSHLIFDLKIAGIIAHYIIGKATWKTPNRFLSKCVFIAIHAIGIFMRSGGHTSILVPPLQSHP
jgi:hypothetical protein